MSITPAERFQRYLETKRLRFSHERKVILQVALRFRLPFAPADLAERLEQQSHCFSRTTLYSTLDLLFRAGLLVRFASSQSVLYLAASHCQGHVLYICQECGGYELVRRDGIYGQLRIPEAPSFQLVQPLLSMYGLCAACHNKRKRLSRKGSQPKETK